LRVAFSARRKTGRWEMEALESAVRAAMHRAGAAALTQLLQFPVPAGDQRNIPCACGHQARYQELRSKPVLTAVGQAKTSRPYYLCADCHHGQFPADVELDIVNTEFSPGVRRMQALVGQEAPFDHGRQQIQLLAGLEVTTKNVERTAEAIGEDIAVGEQAEIQRAKQLDLPIVLGKPIPILCVEIDATGIPVVKKETVGHQGKDGHPARHRDVKVGCVFTQTTWDAEGFAIRDPDSTTYVVRQHGAAAVEGAGHVHRDDLLPVLVGDFPNGRGAARNASVVNQDVDAAGAREHFGHGRIHGIGKRNVDVEGERQSADRLRDNRRAIEVHICDGHSRSGARQTASDSFADAGGRARDDGRLARQFKVH
jgi:hypothetical protein